MSSLVPGTSELSRADYQRTYGFALHTDVGARMLAGVAPQYQLGQTSTHFFDAPPGSVNESVLRDNPAGSSLYLMGLLAGYRLPKPSDGAREFYERYGVTEEDLQRADGNKAFQHGFGDIEFPPYFIAVLANEVTDFLVDQGALTQFEKNDFTFYDWANVLATPWFSHLAHSMAITRNAVYRELRGDLSDFKRGRLHELLVSTGILQQDDPVFVYKERVTSTTGLSELSVDLSKPASLGLRKRLGRTAHSAGCPVARKSVLLSSEQVATDPHVKNLMDGGILHIVPERSTDEQIRLAQDESAIDRMIAFVADRLRFYADEYGTLAVSVNRDYPAITHRSGGPVIDATKSNHFQ